MPYGMFCKLGHAAGFKLFNNLPPVGFNGFYTYIKHGADLFCGPSFGDELKHFSLP